MRDLESFGTEHNSLWHWREAKGFWTVAQNMFLTHLARKIPPEWKIPIYRAMGVEIGDNTRVALDATLDIFFPELIEIGDETIVGYNSVILTHEFLQDEWRKGPVKIGENVMIGSNVTIVAGIEIGDNVSVASGTVVGEDIPPDSIAYGNPMEIEEK